MTGPIILLGRVHNPAQPTVCYTWDEEIVMQFMNRCMFGAILGTAILGLSPVALLAQDANGDVEFRFADPEPPSKRDAPSSNDPPAEFTIEPNMVYDDEPDTIEPDDAPLATRQDVESSDSPDILWPGFVVGQDGFADFVHPVSSPFYFHDPFIDTRVNLLYLHHDFPNDPPLSGGNLNVWAARFYLALTEQLQFNLATDGYGRLRARGLPDDDGWRDLSIGLKYNWLSNPAEQFLLSSGLNWRLSNGDDGVLAGGADELNPYITAAKGWDKLHVIGTLGGRITMDRHRGNHMLYQNLHIDYEVIENFFPLIELNGVQYLSNADGAPMTVGGLDLANIGAGDMRGDAIFWGEIGFRYKILKNTELGATWGFPITEAHKGIFANRVTLSLSIGL